MNKKFIKSFYERRYQPKKKVYARPICVVLTDEMFGLIKGIKDQDNIGIPDYARELIQKKLETDNKKTINKRRNKNERKQFIRK